MKPLLLWIACFPAFAQISTVAVQGITATQAILRYTAPDTGGCSAEVSESASFAPVVHDVDATLFSGSNLDSRAENITSGRDRLFVIGKRRAERAVSGMWYSRALQANTPHFYRITCGASTATGTYSTSNIPLGNSYNDPLPPDPAVAGNTIFSSTGRYAYPQFTKWDPANSTARQEVIVDRDTGAAMKRFAMPGDQNIGNSTVGVGGITGGSTTSILNGAPYGTNWTNPNNAFADDASSTAYSTAGRDWLVLPVSLSLDELQALEADVKVSCSAGACTSPVQAGWSVNGVNAWPSDATAVLVEHVPGTVTPATAFTVFGGTQYRGGDWTPAGLDPLTHADIRTRTGRVDVDGSGNVTWDSGDWFYPGWVAGSKITINSLVCTMTGLTDPRHLAINPASCALSLPSANQVYSANNFALMIRKKVANADTINVQYAQVGYTKPVTPGWSSSGAPHFFSNNLTQNVATGAFGYHSVYLSNSFPMVYWISSADASANYLGFYATGNSSGADGWDQNGCVNASTTLRASGTANQELFNCILTDHSGKQIILNCTMDSTNAAGNLSIACANQTIGSAGKDLGSLAAAFTTGHGTVFDGTRFGCSISGIQNGQLMIGCQRSIQNTQSWMLVYDPARISNNVGCVGGGAPGCVIAAFPTWANLPARYCGIHTLFSAGDGVTNIAWLSLTYFQDTSGAYAGAGPQTSTTASLLTASPAIAAGVGGCPGGSKGCDNIVTDGEPCNAIPCSGGFNCSGGEGGNGSCAKNNAQQGLQNAAPGDVLQISPGAEWVKIVTHTDATHWMIQRAIGPPTSAGGGPQPVDHTGMGTLTLWEFCTARPFNPATDWSADGVTWDFEHDPYGTSTVILPFDTTHPVPRQSGVVGDDYPISTSILAAPTITVSLSSTFAGITGLSAKAEACQPHANHSQDGASASDQNWFCDARPVSGPGPTEEDPFTKVSGQLYKVALIAVPGGDKDNFTNAQQQSQSGSYRAVNRKLLPTMVTVGSQPLVDVSGPGCSLSDTAVDGYKYGIVRVNGECHAGSVVGEVYINAPFVNPRNDGSYGSVIGGQEAALINDLNVFNNDGYTNAIVQFGYQSSNTGSLARRLTTGLMHNKLLDVNMSVKALPNGAFLNIEAPASEVSNAGPMVKLPPYPATDTVNRQSFVPMVLQLTPPSGVTVNNALVQFGYLENGTAAQGYCTSRREACYAVASTIPADPFKFPTDGASQTLATLTGLACSTGCTIAIPALPQRMLYYQVLYRDGSNNIVSTSALQVAGTP